MGRKALQGLNFSQIVNLWQRNSYEMEFFKCKLTDSSIGQLQSPSIETYLINVVKVSFHALDGHVFVGLGRLRLEHL